MGTREEWKPECAECNRLWAEYAKAILRNVELSKLKAPRGKIRTRRIAHGR